MAPVVPRGAAATGHTPSEPATSHRLSRSTSARTERHLNTAAMQTAVAWVPGALRAPAPQAGPPAARQVGPRSLGCPMPRSRLGPPSPLTPLLLYMSRVDNALLGPLSPLLARSTRTVA